MCGIGLTLFPTNIIGPPPFCLATNDDPRTLNHCHKYSYNLDDTDINNNTTSNNHHDSNSHHDENETQLKQDSALCSCQDMNCRNWKDQILHQSLCSRGPDHQCSLWFRHERNVSEEDRQGSTASAASTGWWDMNLYASVLHMRGKDLVGQPYRLHCNSNRDRCYYLCWNGECYSHDAMYGQPFMDIAGRNNNKYNEEGEVDDDDYRNKMSDTFLVLNLIQKALEGVDRAHDVGDLMTRHHERICSVMGQIHGEYSFLLYCPNSISTSATTSTASDDCDNHTGGVIYFGRDPLGRRSLVMGTNKNKNEEDCYSSKGNPILDSLILSSVVPTQMGAMDDNDHVMLFEELPAGRVYCLDIFTGELKFLPITVSSIQQQQRESQRYSTGKPQIPSSLSWVVDDEDISPQILQASEGLYHRLNHAVRRRVIGAPIVTPTEGTANHKHTHASVAVLFSGGVDSVVLAALCHDHVPLDQPIDLINVAFASASSECHEKVDPFSLSPDRQAALLSYQEMKCQWPNRHWRFIAVNVDYETVLQMEDMICKLISPLTSTMDFNIGTAMWFASRGLGEEIVDGADLDDKVWKPEMLKESKHLRFCQRSTTASSDKGRNGKASARQCMTRGCKRLAERDGCRFGVCKVCCASVFHRRINQYLGGRADLCDYHTELAKSIKNKGKKKSNVQEDTKRSTIQQKKTGKASTDRVRHASNVRKRLYQSRAKVVIVGIGADEQMAGYGRHRVIYNRGGYEALRQELAMEKSRLWTRNLGRDDRCISSHGKEARFPFLDDDVTAYLNSLDVTEMVDLSKPLGMGDKMILRLIARRLGVTQCSGLVKRAIQFGSRIAKCSEVDRFGSSRNASGSAKHIRSNPVDKSDMEE